MCGSSTVQAAKQYVAENPLPGQAVAQRRPQVGEVWERLGSALRYITAAREDGAVCYTLSSDDKTVDNAWVDLETQASFGWRYVSGPESPDSALAPTFKFEVGKVYVDRDGGEYECIEVAQNGVLFKFRGDDTYAANGIIGRRLNGRYHATIDGRYDIIAEKPAAKPLVFEVGKWYEDSEGDKWLVEDVGSKYVIAKYSSGRYPHIFNLDGTPGEGQSRGYRLVRETAAPDTDDNSDESDESDD